MLGMGNMRQWLMNISLVGGWFPAAAFAVVAVLSVTLLVSAAVSKRDGRILATVLPIGVAAVSGMIGYVELGCCPTCSWCSASDWDPV